MSSYWLLYSLAMRAIAITEPWVYFLLSQWWTRTILWLHPPCSYLRPTYSRLQKMSAMYPWSDLSLSVLNGFNDVLGTKSVWHFLIASSFSVLMFSTEYFIVLSKRLLSSLIKDKGAIVEKVAFGAVTLA